MVICANYRGVSGRVGDRKDQEIYAACQLIYSMHCRPKCVCELWRQCAGKHLAAVVPSDWQGPLINELSQPRSLRRARGHTSVCHSGLTPSPSPAASRSPRDFPDVPRFLYPAQGVTVAKSLSWHCFCDTWISRITLLQSSECFSAGGHFVPAFDLFGLRRSCVVGFLSFEHSERCNFSLSVLHEAVGPEFTIGPSGIKYQ